MQSLRQVIPKAPELIVIPEEFRDKPIELTIRPLEDGEPDVLVKTGMDAAFGLWSRLGTPIDGLEYQERLRAEWQE